jgi:hypothetical protein
MASNMPPKHVEHINWILETLRKNSYIWLAARIATYNKIDQYIWPISYYSTLKCIPDDRIIHFRELEKVVWTLASGINLSELEQPAVSIAIQIRGAISALVAYADCEQYIDMKYEKLELYAKLSEKPQAILLLPMVYVREKLGIETVENNSILL